MIRCNWSSRDGSAFSRGVARGLGPATLAFLRGVPGTGGVVTASLAALARVEAARLRGAADGSGGGGLRAIGLRLRVGRADRGRRCVV